MFQITSDVQLIIIVVKSWNSFKYKSVGIQGSVYKYLHLIFYLNSTCHSLGKNWSVSFNC